MNVTLLTNEKKENSIITGINKYSECLFKQFQSIVSINYVSPRVPSKIIVGIGKILRKDMHAVFQQFPLSFPKIPSENVIHCTSQNLALPLLFKKRKCVVTVHDIIPFATKTYSTSFERLVYPFLLRALRTATHIIADSEYTKKDLLRYIQYPSNKITVIPLGIDHNEFHPNKKLRRKKNTLLYVGSEAKRKNLIVLLKALALVTQEIPEVQLIKVGKAQDATMHKKILKTISQLNLTEHVIWKDYVEALRDEYNQATLFVFPSLYEGFGFPVLEAMACGCPVITSDKTSIPEIAGDAAMYFDGQNEKDLAKKIIFILKDKSVQQKMAKKGMNQAKKFTWEKCAEETMKVYEHVNVL